VEGALLSVIVEFIILITYHSGTNGYVMRNLSALRVHETAADRAAAWDVAPPKHREPDEAILEHERKRKVEVKCLELQLQLEDDGCVDSNVCVSGPLTFASTVWMKQPSKRELTNFAQL
jgi:hypothetical protein